MFWNGKWRLLSVCFVSTKSPSAWWSQGICASLTLVGCRWQARIMNCLMVLGQSPRTRIECPGIKPRSKPRSRENNQITHHWHRDLPSLWRSNWEFLKSFCSSIVLCAGTTESLSSTAKTPAENIEVITKIVQRVCNNLTDCVKLVNFLALHIYAHVTRG